MVYLTPGEEREIQEKPRFRGFNRGPMPEFYGDAEILSARSLEDYNDRDAALSRCDGPVYEIETVHRIRRIK